MKKKETEERKRQEELEKQKRNETYQLLGGSQNDSDADDDSSLDGNIQQLENYSYFDGDKILESLKLAPKDRKNGEAIYRQQKMNVTDISCGYVRRADTEPGICTKQFLGISGKTNSQKLH